jgi:hypothetical protein
MFLVGEVEAKEINYDREANRAHARGSAEKDPGNYCRTLAARILPWTRMPNWV